MPGSSPSPLFSPTVPNLGGLFGGISLQLEFSPLVLVVLTMLVGIFVAALSVMLVYHWRRFPFEHSLFHVVERVYITGVVVLLAASVVGILLTA